MLEELGNRELTYIDAAGEEGTIRISLESHGTRRTDLGGGEYLDEIVGAVTINSIPITHRIELTGVDNIQLVYRLLWIADIYVQARFSERGLIIYKVVPGDVDRPFGIYN